MWKWLDKHPVFGILYSDIVYSRTGGRFFLFVERLTGYAYEKYRFRKNRGYPLNLKNPSTYAEKIVWKKLHDRNPLLTITSDKYRVREYVRKRLGEDLAEEILVPLLYVTDKPETIPFDELPEKYIIKANHGSGWNLIVDSQDLDRETLVRTCKGWLKKTYGITKHEWAYFHIPPKIVVEKLLTDEGGKIPRDYKFYTFHGTVRVINVIEGRQEDEKWSNSYDRDWNYLERADGRPPRFSSEKPAAFDRMLFIAETLARDFDAVRVDLYTLGERVYFGELTHYHSSGSNMKKSLEEDVRLGGYWHLDLKAGGGIFRW